MLYGTIAPRLQSSHYQKDIQKQISVSNGF